MNTPNKLTVFRMILTPLFLIFILAPLPHRFLLACAVFALASVTDAIDGKLARKNNQITVFGKLLDPVADKMLTTAALLAFMNLGWCSIWIVFTVLTREFAVTSMRLIAAAQNVVIPANIWGKIKTATLMAFIIIIMLIGELQSVFGLFAESLPLISNILLGINAAICVVSGIVYLINGAKAVNFTK